MSATSGETSNYEYVTARVRARRAALYDPEDYRKLVRMGESEIARYMEENEYEREVNALGTRHSGTDLIEYALNRNMARHFDDILRWAEGQLYDRLVRYLRKYDAWNVKTVLRGIYAGADEETTQDDLIRAGAFTDAFLDQLVGLESIEEVIEHLDGTIFGGPVADAASVYEETGRLVPLENAVDRAYYRTLLGEVPQNPEEATALYVEFLRAEIDFLNLRNALRLTRSGADIDPSEYYIEGGELFTATSLRQAVGDLDLIVEQARDSPYETELVPLLEDIEPTGSLVRIEHTLDAALLEFADRMVNRYPISISPVLSFILAKEREVENIRAIARGKEAGLDPDEIEEELVMI